MPLNETPTRRKQLNPELMPLNETPTRRKQLNPELIPWTGARNKTDN